MVQYAENKRIHFLLPFGSFCDTLPDVNVETVEDFLLPFGSFLCCVCGSRPGVKRVTFYSLLGVSGVSLRTVNFQSSLKTKTFLLPFGSFC